MRLFAGIPVPPSALPAMEKACLPLVDALGVKMVEPQNLHITLKFIGEADEATAGKISEALALVRFSPFMVSLFGAGAFPNADFPRTIWIGGKSDGAKNLSASLEEALSFLRLKSEKFSIHLTVARAPKSVADIEDFLQKTGEVCNFWAKSFCLVRSRLTPAGPIYEVIKEYNALEG